MQLSVVIVNYNVKHFLHQCLLSVEQATSGLEAEVFVVDNNSVDGSVEMVRNTFPWTTLIANTDNVGFSKANNQAIEKSTGEYVLLLNPDTVVPENCFSKILAFADKAADFGACGIHMVDGQGKFLPESKRGLPTPEVALYKMMGLNRLFPRSKKFGKYHLGYLPENENNEVEILSGAFMLIHRNALNKVGLLDTDFFMYGEDIDLSYRITQGGFKNYYFAEASIIHYKGESTKKLSANYVRVFYKAMILFARKHYSGGALRLFTFFIQAAIYARAGVALAVNFIKSTWLAFFEAGLMFLILYLLKEYWEEHIKFIKSYPREMMTVHLPYYTAIWALSLWFNGSYNAPFRFDRLLRAMAIGSVLIASVYGLLPEHLHFSRGIILFGTLATTMGLLLWRTVFHFLKYRSLNFDHSKYTRSILVGSEERWKFVTDILSSHGRNAQQLGYLSNSASDNEYWLGSIDQLEEVVKIYDVNEVIFSAASISSEETMGYMKRLGPHISYYIIPTDSDFVIGSHSKNATGLHFGEQVKLNLSKKENKRQKRVFDVVASCAIAVQFFWLILFPYGRHLLANVWSVVLGKKTWVGYAGNDTQQLPDIKPGVVNTAYQLKQKNSQFEKQLNQLYAKNYAINLDVKALLKI